MLTIKLSVGKRISLGYAIALGVTILGTVAGFSIGKNYLRQASEWEEHAREEMELLHHLQIDILQARTHQQKLIPLVQYPQRYAQEYNYLLQHKAAIENSWTKLKTLIKLEAVSSGDVHLTEIPNFLHTYNQVVQKYFQELESRKQQIQALNLNVPENIEKAQKILLEFTDSELSLQFDRISDDVDKLMQKAYTETKKSEEFQLTSSQISQKIIIVSIIISTAISIILAIFTSRAIAYPIQAITNIARRSTEESNFDLQVTINRNDELGVLGNSFNQLIATVKHLITQQQQANEQLINYNETLENRNQEIIEKNLQLQQLLAELQRSQLQIVQSEKMSALGQMVAGIAHEINNPVSFIHGNLKYVQEYTENLIRFVQLYHQYYPEPLSEIVDLAEDIDLDFIQQDLPKMLNSMKIGTDRICKIVLSLRNFSRLDESEFKAVDIHEGIDNTLLILQHRLRENSEHPEIQVIKNYGDLPLIECYPGQLNQVFMNILVNAIDALEEKIDTTKINQIIITTSVKDNQWLQIAIADNGSGIPADIQAKIFQPFFTTKPCGKGTGLGMSISQQIITERHGGKLECFSTLGQGTEFLIEVPVHQNFTLTPVK